MSKIHISQFYPCSKIELAAELYYICELGKYLSYNFGDTLSIDGVILDNSLKKSNVWEYFRLAVSKDWVCDTGITDSDFEVSVMHPLMSDVKAISNVLLTTDSVYFNKDDFNKRNNDMDYAYATPELLQISFAEQKENAWLWDMSGASGKCFNVNNKVFGHNLAYQRFTSLVAYVAVTRLKTGNPVHFGVCFNQAILLNNFTVPSYLTILSDYCNCLDDWCHILYSDDILPLSRLQVDYSAWYQKGKDLGMLDRWYTGKEKYEYCKKLDIQRGDIVMLYSRPKSSKMNFVKSIDSCHIARVDYLTENDIGLTLFNTTKLYYQAKTDFDNQTIAVKKMYCGKTPYENMNTSSFRTSLADCGVEYMMHNELNFILPLDQCDDEVETLVSNGFIENKLILGQNDYIYWLLEDYNVEYNRERFLDKYFKGEQPFRDYYFSIKDNVDALNKALNGQA